MPDHEKRSYPVGTKLTEIEHQILEAKIKEYKMTIYGYLKQALNNCKIDTREYDQFIDIVNEFSISHLMRLCIIQSNIYPRITKEELDAYKDLTMNLRNYGRNIREIAIKADEYNHTTKYVETINEELKKLENLRKEFNNRLRL